MFQAASQSFVLGKRSPQRFVGLLPSNRIGEDFADHLQSEDDFRRPFTTTAEEIKRDCAEHRAAGLERNGYIGLDAVGNTVLPFPVRLER